MQLTFVYTSRAHAEILADLFRSHEQGFAHNNADLWVKQLATTNWK